MASVCRRSILALALVLVMAGCIGPFAGDDIDDEALDAEANYTWDHPADAYIQLSVGSYTAVYELDGQDSFELSRMGWGTRQAVDVTAVRYRFPNGTELTGSDLDIDQSSGETTIDVPDGNGTLAFTGPAGSKEAEIPGLTTGTYVVELPGGHRVTNYFLSDVQPSADNVTLVDDRHVLQWDDHGGDLFMRYHLWRDHYLLYGAVLILTGIAVGGTLYYRRKIRRTIERRQELGLDVEDDE